MEINDDEQANKILEIIKVFNDNNNFYKNNNIDFELFNKLKEDDNNNSNSKKKISTLKFKKVYIINKKPLEELMNELHYNDNANILNEDDDIDDEELYNKIKNSFNDDININIQKYINQLEFYNTEEKINEIINGKKDILFVQKEFLKSLDVPLDKYENKEVLFTINKAFILFYFPQEMYSIMVNLSILYGEKFQSKNNKKNSLNDLNHNEEELKKILKNNLNIISLHKDYLNEIEQLDSITVNNLNDTEHIHTKLFHRSIVI